MTAHRSPQPPRSVTIEEDGDVLRMRFRYRRTGIAFLSVILSVLAIVVVYGVARSVPIEEVLAVAVVLGLLALATVPLLVNSTVIVCRPGLLEIGRGPLSLAATQRLSTDRISKLVIVEDERLGTDTSEPHYALRALPEPSGAQPLVDFRTDEAAARFVRARLLERMASTPAP